MRRTALVTVPFIAIALALPAAAQHRLLVLNKADHTMSIVDPAAMKVLGTVPVGRGPHEAVVSADGKTGYVANYGDQQPNNSISIVDIASMKERTPSGSTPRTSAPTPSRSSRSALRVAASGR